MRVPTSLWGLQFGKCQHKSSQSMFVIKKLLQKCCTKGITVSQTWTILISQPLCVLQIEHDKTHSIIPHTHWIFTSQICVGHTHIIVKSKVRWGKQRKRITKTHILTLSLHSQQNKTWLEHVDDGFPSPSTEISDHYTHHRPMFWILRFIARMVTTFSFLIKSQYAWKSCGRNHQQSLLVDYHESFHYNHSQRYGI